ncbi:hypothetical protein ACGLWX_18205 [Halomonas sp. HMF6819]|uniref:hypothetical protein n=1 Tax=Halomonas sp. HMF6819 TaxID=3373085 RepID=UPI0037926E09
MAADKPDSPSSEEMEARRQVWERIKATAQRVHNHPSDHGINTKIANDADRASQTVGDWKHGRSPIPPSAIAALAKKYNVSPLYLACETNDPTQLQPIDEAELKILALELVEEALARASEVESLDPIQGAKLAMTAYEMARAGHPRATILGYLIYEAEGRS